ncbi:MAG TPA: family 20 glycosylhydrolase [Caulobacterales bacterium]|nr:family 20 glycosylhydrolase [Caulobacterales bacterium]
MNLVKSGSFLPAALFALFLVAGASVAHASSLALVPAPRSIETHVGAFTLSEDVSVYAAEGDAGAMAAAQRFVDLVRRTRHLRIAIRRGAPQDGAIVFARDATMASEEAYAIRVRPQGVVVSASGDAGLYYGATTLWQMATLQPGRGRSDIPAADVDDAPRFAWRGLMLDSARHFQSVDFIKHFIDAMATEKFNVLHWHLTDDQGWRLEIRKYPRLTQVGAYRRPAGEAGKHQPRYGGFYTQAEVREIVAYAAAHHITVVPEIEMPGHATAAIVAYPQFGAALHPPTNVGADWGIYPNLYNTDDATFAFLEDVLTEVMALFPSQYIHVGGDEAVKQQWLANPEIQARMRAAGVANEAALQGWFTARIGRFLAAHGRRLIGWDEILEGGVPPDATVMSWRGVEGAIAAARAGHDTVLSPWPLLYFDNRQSASPDEPPGRGRLLSVRDVYAFDPAPAQLSDAERAHVIGVQANLWSEHMRSEANVEGKAFPRAAAVAEAAWSPPARDWNDFAPRLTAEIARYDALGIRYARTAVDVIATPQLIAGGAEVALATPSDIGDIRYTTDGAAPAASSQLYSTPIRIALPARVRAQAFVDGRALGEPQDWRFDAAAAGTRSSQLLKQCADKLGLNLEDDAPRGAGARDRAVFMIDVMEPCWIYEGASLDGVTQITASVGQTPFNFQIGDDVHGITFRPPSSALGELEARLDSCDGRRIAVLPLEPTRDRPGVTTLSAPIEPIQGRHDICFTFTAAGVDPMYAIDWVRIAPPPQR